MRTTKHLVIIIINGIIIIFLVFYVKITPSDWLRFFMIGFLFVNILDHLNSINKSQKQDKKQKRLENILDAE